MAEIRPQISIAPKLIAEKKNQCYRVSLSARNDTEIKAEPG